MPSFFIYLLKANIALTVCYLAYRFGLRRLTFYTLNRFFLLFGIVFSAVFPLVDMNGLLNGHKALAGRVAYYAPDWDSLREALHPQYTFTWWDLLQYVFWAGVAVMTVRFIIQLLSLLRIHRRSHTWKINGEKIRLMEETVNPFSFFANIYVNPSLHSEDDLQAVIIHEKIHVSQWHTADVMAGEVNNIFYWFNPGAWLMKTAIRENLEFITDRKILLSGMDARTYQYSLVKVSGTPYATSLANNFNFSHLKQRIMMMNKKRSSRINFLRYVVLIPIMVGITLLIFTNSRGQEPDRISQTILKSTMPPAQDLDKTIVRDSIHKPAVVFLQPMITQRHHQAPPPSSSRDDDYYANLAYENALRKNNTGAERYAKQSLKINPENATAKQLESYLKKVREFNGKMAEHRKEYEQKAAKAEGKFTSLRVEKDTIPPPPPRPKKNVMVTVKGTDGHNPPLLIVDDKIVPAVKLKDLNPDQIVSVSVLKDTAAKNKYGEKGRNGVIMIMTKDQNNASQVKTTQNLSEPAVAVDAPITVYGKPAKTHTDEYIFRDNMTDDEITQLKSQALNKSKIKIEVTSIKRDPFTKLITAISVKATDQETGSSATFYNNSRSRGGVLGAVSKTWDKKMKVTAFGVN